MFLHWQTASPALADWSKALRLWRLWTALGFEDLTDRYRRTVFGISWVVASFAAFVFVKVLVFGQVAAVPLNEFAMFVTTGFGLWSFISTVVLDACVVYTASANWILGTALPYPVFIFQTVYRNWLVFALTLVVIAAALAWQKPVWTPVSLAALPALAIYVLTPVWVSAILAPLCARYRDMQHAVQTVMRLLFFVTPIIWMPKQSPQLSAIAQLNVVTHYIEIVRQPLIEDTIPYSSWIIVLSVTILGTVVGFLAYASTRNRVAFWL